MTLVRYNPVFPRLASSLFSDFLTDFPTKSHINPKVDIVENEASFEVQVSLPGFKKEDIKVEVDENKLTISGERKFEKQEEDKNKKYHLVETEYGSFTRSFSLPNHANVAAIAANFKDGILELSIPKENKEQKKQVISVN